MAVNKLTHSLIDSINDCAIYLGLPHATNHESRRLLHIAQIKEKELEAIELSPQSTKITSIIQRAKENILLFKNALDSNSFSLINIPITIINFFGRANTLVLVAAYVNYYLYGKTAGILTATPYLLMRVFKNTFQISTPSLFSKNYICPFSNNPISENAKLKINGEYIDANYLVLYAITSIDPSINPITGKIWTEAEILALSEHYSISIDILKFLFTKPEESIDQPQERNLFTPEKAKEINLLYGNDTFRLTQHLSKDAMALFKKFSYLERHITTMAPDLLKGFHKVLIKFTKKFRLEQYLAFRMLEIRRPLPEEVLSQQIYA